MKYSLMLIYHISTFKKNCFQKRKSAIGKVPTTPLFSPRENQNKYNCRVYDKIINRQCSYRKIPDF